MSGLNSGIAAIGIDIGKNSFHVVGQDERGALVLRQKWSRGQVEARLANLPACLIGMEACVGAHHLSRKLQALGHDGVVTEPLRPEDRVGAAPLASKVTGHPVRNYSWATAPACSFIPLCRSATAGP